VVGVVGALIELEGGLPKAKQEELKSVDQNSPEGPAKEATPGD